MLHHLMFLAICLIWGSSFILMKKAALAFGPIGVAGWRVAGGAAALGLVWWLMGSRWTLRRGDAMALGVVVLFGCLWPYTVQPLVIHRYADSAFMGVVTSFVPLLTVLLSLPMLKLYPTRRQLAGVMGGLVCMVLLLGDGFLRQIAVSDLVLAATVPISYAISANYIRRRFSKCSPLVLCIATNGIAAMVLIPVSSTLAPVHTGDQFAVAVLCLALLGVLGTGFASYLHYILIQQRGPLFAGMVTYVVPIGAVAWGWWDGETITAIQIAALLGVLAMVALVQLGPSASVPQTTGAPEVPAEIPPLPAASPVNTASGLPPDDQRQAKPAACVRLR